jgi:preprotein translocase subunit SecF
MKLNVVKFRHIWYVVSAITIGLSILFLSMWGLKQGIDFTGGTLMAVRFVERPSSTDVQRVLDQSGVELGSVVIQPVAETDMQFRLKPLTEEEHAKVFGALSNAYPTVSELRFDAIGPVVGEELRRKSFQGLAIVLIAIMAYVAYVFRKVSAPVQSWKYGLVTILTAFHDVIVPLGVFAWLGHYYDVEVGTSFIAAILTILGYSITDTVVVLDRIRENLPKHAGSFGEIVEVSVHQTFMRSINTSFTTLLTLGAVHFFGGSTLHEFTLTLMIGIAVGTYSSIFIASPLLVSWHLWTQKQKRA